MADLLKQNCNDGQIKMDQSDDEIFTKRYLRLLHDKVFPRITNRSEAASSLKWPINEPSSFELKTFQMERLTKSASKNPTEPFSVFLEKDSI